VPAERWMVVGTIVGSFGLQGELKVELNTDFPERFRDLTDVYVGTERQRRQVAGSRKHGGRVLLRLQGVTSPEEAGALRGRELAVPRTEAMPLPEGHYYLGDLIGVEVRTVDGLVLGAVIDVLRTGSNDVYVVGDDRKPVLVPAIKDAVRELDLERRSLIIESWVLNIDE
jgi:16S rRNA processing protein RimM